MITEYANCPSIAGVVAIAAGIAAFILAVPAPDARGAANDEVRL